MSFIYEIKNLEKIKEEGSIYIQCPCCQESFDYYLDKYELDILNKEEDIYCKCIECGNSFYLSL